TFLFSALLSCLVAVVFTVAPAWRALVIAPAEAMKGGGRQDGAAAGESRPARLIVAAQIAFSMLLLTSAALFLRTVDGVLKWPSGGVPAGVWGVAPDPPAGANRQAFYRDLSSRLASISGVASASLSWVPPISDDLGSWTQTIGVDGAPPSTEVAHNAPDAVFFNAVSPGYFETVGTRLLAGRGFAWRDRNGSPRVVVVNESLARRAFGNQNPIGHRITIGLDPARRDLEIVGLVQDAKYQRLQEAMQAIAYLPYEQGPEFVAGNNLVSEVRTIGRPAAGSEPVGEPG